MRSTKRFCSTHSPIQVKPRWKVLYRRNILLQSPPSFSLFRDVKISWQCLFEATSPPFLSLPLSTPSPFSPHSHKNQERFRGREGGGVCYVRYPDHPPAFLPILYMQTSWKERFLVSNWRKKDRPGRHVCYSEKHMSVILGHLPFPSQREKVKVALSITQGYRRLHCTLLWDSTKDGSYSSRSIGS